MYVSFHAYSVFKVLESLRQDITLSVPKALYWPHAVVLISHAPAVETITKILYRSCTRPDKFDKNLLQLLFDLNLPIKSPAMTQQPQFSNSISAVV